ncbi:hypothetical protein J4422_00460 [Candidatus Pacearchaeota archaeon]|nr:hypothetical protein [Candidatus Pacearchaeota archaeon]
MNATFTLDDLIDWSRVGRGLKINLVADTRDRQNSPLCSFEDLPHNCRYSLHVEYDDFLKAEPYQATGLTHKELLKNIAKSSIISVQSRRIYVAREREKVGEVK